MNRRWFLKSVAGAGVTTALPLPVTPAVTTLTTYVPKIGETIQVRMPMRYSLNPGDRFAIAGIERTFVVASMMKLDYEKEFTVTGETVRIGGKFGA